MTLLTKDLKIKIARELAEVREDNSTEGTEYFQMMMYMLEEDDRYEEDFNDIIMRADAFGKEL